ncbi:MAG: GNAT family protein [Bacillota bacterium]|nr:GNAT family protein [Bacillota bacterium]
MEKYTFYIGVLMKMWESLFNLEGKGVQLLPMEMEHVDGLWEFASKNEIWTYMPSKVRTKNDLEMIMKLALEEREKGLQYPFVVLDKTNNKLVGSTRYLDISSNNKSLEIGWTWYDPAVWRSHVNTECKFMLLEHAFQTWNSNRVQFKTDLRNIRSQTAIGRLGAQKEGILRKDRVLSDGFVRDTVVFSILKEEWPKRRGIFVNKLLKGV